MPKNGSITAFFKPVSSSGPRKSTPPPSAPLPQASQPSVSSPWLPAPKTLPRLPSSPLVSPERNAGSSLPRGLDAVIKGSDEEEDGSSSDSDLPDILALSKSKVPVPAKGELNPCVTPRAKRTAVPFLASPLPNRVKHKFDLKALQEQARQSDATMASAQGVASLLEAGEKEAEAERLRSKPSETFDAAMDSLLEVDKDLEKDGSHSRLRRAVKRTNAAFSSRQWRFFQDAWASDPPAPEQNPFPKAAAAGRWKFLADTRSRTSFFQERMPFKLQSKKPDLPDEIFLWVWSKIPSEPSGMLREEYIRLVAACPEQVGRLVDKELLGELFLTLGATREAVDLDSKLQAMTEAGDHRPEKDWSGLQAVLQLLSRIAESMSIGALEYSVSIAIRLGMDMLVREDLTLSVEYGDTMSSLVEAVPSVMWDDFCDTICQGLFQSVEQASLRWDAVSTMPAAGVRPADLRCRLARAFFFDDLSKACWDPETESVIKAITEKLQTAKFSITHDTDYVELKALISILSIAVDDGGRPPASSPKAQRQEFDAGVDELSRLVRFQWSSVHEGGSQYLERLEVRSLLQNLERELLHAVRTCPPPKLTVFDDAPQDDDEKYRPRQQEFMKNFLQRR